jgi:hypothetical protein
MNLAANRRPSGRDQCYREGEANFLLEFSGGVREIDDATSDIIADTVTCVGPASIRVDVTECRNLPSDVSFS